MAEAPGRGSGRQALSHKRLAVLATAESTLHCIEASCVAQAVEGACSRQGRPADGAARLPPPPPHRDED